MRLFARFFKFSGKKFSSQERLELIGKAGVQVGPGVFWSTIITIASFLPVFLLTGQEGKLFSPLAWTKTIILLVDAIIAISVTPVLIYYFLRGKFRPESQNPVNRFLEKLYSPVLRLCMKFPKTLIVLHVLVLGASVPVALRLGTEFMPPLDEGSILFMPITLPDVSNAEVKRLLQLQDKLIKSVPEVEQVLGKAGRANTATDNSPISMIETIILLKPKDQWRPGLTKQDIVRELDAKVQIPGVVNAWTQPIINRINMLSTGIRTDVGVKVYGQTLDSINALAQQVKTALTGVPGVKDLYVEPITGGKYLIVDIRREELGRYGLSVDDVNMLVESAIGGAPVSPTIEGRRRFSVGVRLMQDYRNSLEMLRRLPVQTPTQGVIPLSAVADLRFEDGAPMINSENALLRGAVLFNVRERDLGGTVKDAMAKLNADLSGKIPDGYFLDWSGQWENQIRATRTLSIIMPIVLVIVLCILYFTFNSMQQTLLNVAILPFAMMGGVFAVAWFGANLSVAVAVGFVAVFGLSIETSMVMMVYLSDSMKQLEQDKGVTASDITPQDIRTYVHRGAAQRVRPLLMTGSVGLYGLIPILWATGVGTDVMKPIVLPMLGGVFTSTLVVLFLMPILFELAKTYELKKYGRIEVVAD